MKPERTIGSDPSAQEIRAALDRVVASDVMRVSPQLTAFLRFVVEATLDGNSDRIKGYVIAVEVLKRDAQFNPQIDPIVRVEATRLRRTLERYYAGAGADDPIVIGLPRGAYVPTFRRRRGPRGAAEIPDAPADTPAGGEAPPETLAPGNGMPVLLVQRFEVVGTAGPRSISAASLHEMLSDAFAHFDLVNIVWEPPEGGRQARDPAAAPAAEARIDFRLAGSAEYDDDGSARLRFRLIDAADGNVVWTRVFAGLAASDDPAAAQEAIVRELAATLVQPFGVIFAYGSAKSLGGEIGDPRYRCILEAAESFRSFDPAQHRRARACLERLTGLDPGFAVGFTYLAALYVREHLYGLDAGADLPPLERALRAARRGIELKPESARAYEMLFFTLFARRDLPAAFAAGDKAMELNKYDLRAIGGYGQRLVAIGEIDKGMDMLTRAGHAGGVRPAVDQFFLFLGSYLRDDAAAAAFHAGQLTSDTFQLGLVARALVAAQAGEGDTARAALERLAALNPAWRHNPRGELEKFFPAAFIVDRLAAGLAAAARPVR
jgi:tetratricopeptide (TPR) repeat protein